MCCACPGVFLMLCFVGIGLGLVAAEHGVGWASVLIPPAVVILGMILYWQLMAMFS